MAQLDTTPYWQTSATLPTFPALDQDLEVDVAIVGGGITGITTAYLLKQSGRRVAVIERGRCASAETGHTTAHLTSVTDLSLRELVRTFGRDHARAAWDAGFASLMQIAAIVEAERIACDFDWVPAYQHAPAHEAGNENDAGDENDADEGDVAGLREEAALAAEMGFDATFMDLVPFANRPGIRFDGQAVFHPLKYLAHLLKLIPGHGSHVFEQTSVDEVTDDPLTIRAGTHRIRAGYVVMATHTPLMGKTNPVSATLLQTKLYLYSTYVLGGYVEAGRVPHALYWDTCDPYHYLRVNSGRDRDYVIFGGEDHKTGQVEDTSACFTRLEQTLKTLLPEIDITHRWSGQVIETNDGLPFIGETSDRQFSATGFAGTGMTGGTLAAIMARDAVVGTRNPWSELFDVGRTKIKGGAWDYLKENKDYPYYLVRDRLASPEAKSLRAVRRGEGRIVEIGGRRVAASRGEDGRVTTVSAVCTHMGCLVRWNDAEQSWDCPCHGSRFQPGGKVFAGPATSPLEAVDLDAPAGTTAR